jgi:hypothetical protein
VRTGEPARFESDARALGRWFDVYAFRVGPPERRRVAVLFKDSTERKRANDDQLVEIATLPRQLPVMDPRRCRVLLGDVPAAVEHDEPLRHELRRNEE